MKILNVHSRTINRPKEEIAQVLATLASKDDKVWPVKSWPRIYFGGDNRIGSEGGHGPVRYVIERFDPKGVFQFRFLRPKGFNGIHKFEIKPITDQQTEVVHTISMTTKGMATLQWYVVIRPLHDALLEDLLDRVENQFTEDPCSSEWSLWVRLMRRLMA
jgi:hypothetical protein